MPNRRSARLRGSNVTPAKSHSYTPNRLASLAERDETPTSGPQPTLDAIVSSPLAPRTPATNIKPSLEEMHPSKVHHTTTKEPDSGLRLGFADIDTKARNQPSGVKQQTPSKTGISSPASDFRFARPGPQLGPEAQRMMDELREEALRIKAKLAAEREEEKRKPGGASADFMGGRKIAQPKGKVGRFSDIHMAEFKKMDSIAGHASAFRAQPGRFAPPANNLKRSQSKARLDDREETGLQHEEMPEKSERLENKAPAKRARQRISDDTSSARPVSRDGNKVKPASSTSTLSRSQSSMLGSITTPTQASLARAAALKHPSSQIPTLARSPSKLNVAGTPRGLVKSATTDNFISVPKSEPKSFLRSPGKFDRVKSILRYPSSSTKNQAAAPSSISTFARSPSKPNLDKALPSVPSTPTGADRPKPTKHVNFTPDTINKNAAGIQNSPSPMKSGIPRSTSKINFGVKPKEKAGPGPSVVIYPNLSKYSRDVDYPSLDGLRPLPEPPRAAQAAQHPPPSVPGTFTFRSDHTINFGSSPKGFGSSPGQASVRQVRQSILPNSMPGSFPPSNKENNEPLPAVPHGMSNKKRRRVESDDEQEEDSRSPKKLKSKVAESPNPMAASNEENADPKLRFSGQTRKKGVLSLSRLNMLARPKVRR